MNFLLVVCQTKILKRDNLTAPFYRRNNNSMVEILCNLYV